MGKPAARKKIKKNASGFLVDMAGEWENPDAPEPSTASLQQNGNPPPIAFVQVGGS